MQVLPGYTPPVQTLRALVAVARLRSFTKAADALGITQTAVSHQIAQLEDWIGGPLFVRDRSGVALTRLGAGLVPDIAALLETLSTILERTRQSVGIQRLRVSTTPEFAAQWLAPRLPQFCSAHPDIDLSVTVEYRRTRFAADEVDLAIWLAGPSTGSEQLTNDEEFAVCAPSIAVLLPERNALGVAPLLRYAGSRHTALDWGRWHGQMYDQVPATTDFDGGPCYPTFVEMLEACRRGEGFALVRSCLVDADIRAGRLVRCFTESTLSDLQYQLAIAPDRKRDADIVAFQVWLFDQMSPMRDRSGE
ncbi:LysR family transcriptional regulator [Aminobacter sp. AP02]|uniref:LysR family transcriptional regulator n=1 Tax=Aminobacter sp. AP02 TaxID=2135737 RepID=UPI000D6C0779|nr:LysR family transcriptional regulator [Aminobacter sp. AP02]PWK68406.1 LysR family glycine cleavage system transcriptional activator [Aminobacter sp. AP02]